MDRRDFLWSASGVGLAVVAGRSIAGPTRYRADPVAKTVFTHDPSTSPPSRIDLLQRRYDDADRGPYYSHSAQSPLDRRDDDRPLFVDDETHEWIESNYTRATYLVELCGVGVDEPREYGCRTVSVSREDFNAFTLGDRLLVRFENDRIEAVVEQVNEGAGEPARADGA